MTDTEFLSFLEQSGAFIGNPLMDERSIQITNSGLQNISAATLPMFMLEFYKKFGCIVLGNSYIFGISETKDTLLKYPVPGLFNINNELSGLKQIRGKTIFGRNDLFLFAFDAFGKFFMLDNLTLSPVREYSDPWRAVYDCSVIGKL